MYNPNINPELTVAKFTKLFKDIQDNTILGTFYECLKEEYEDVLSSLEVNTGAGYEPLQNELLEKYRYYEICDNEVAVFVQCLWDIFHEYKHEFIQLATNYYKEYNGKYFMIEPVIWGKLNQYNISYYSFKILGYTTFGGKDYEDSNLKKVLAELLEDIKPEKELLREVKYSNPYPESADEKIIDHSYAHYKYAGNGYTYQKDKSKVYTGYIFPLQIADVEDSYVSVTDSKRGYTDYALEQYRLLTKNCTLNSASSKYWTRTVPPSGFVYMGDLNKRMYKYDKLYAKESMRESENCIAGVRPMINIDYNRLISAAKEKKNGF